MASQFVNLPIPAGTGSGNVIGPGASTNRAIVTWNGTSGTALFNNGNVTISAAGVLSSNKLITAGGGLSVKRTATAISYTQDANDCLIGVTDTSSARTITLLAVSALVVGQQLIIKDESGAAATHNITITPDGSDTIDGSASATISANSGVVRLYVGGSGKWFSW